MCSAVASSPFTALAFSFRNLAASCDLHPHPAPSCTASSFQPLPCQALDHVMPRMFFLTRSYAQHAVVHVAQCIEHLEGTTAEAAAYDRVSPPAPQQPRAIPTRLSAGCKWALRAATHAILPHTISFPGGRGAKELRAAAAAAAAAAAPVARAAACWLLAAALLAVRRTALALQCAPPPAPLRSSPAQSPSGSSPPPPRGGSVAFDRAVIGAGQYFCFWCRLTELKFERAPRAARSAELGARVQGGQEARWAPKGRRSTHTGAAAYGLRGWNS
jgi:hypothetical protein